MPTTMFTKARIPITALTITLILGAIILMVWIIPLRFGTSTARVVSTGNSLLDRARLGTWYLPARAIPPIIGHGYDPSGPNNANGYQESDFIYSNGKYYLFATGSEEPARIDVYVGDTPEDLVKGPPAFSQVAPIRYPTVVKDGDTWHMWGVNPTKKWTEHWVSTNADPTGFVFADAAFPGSSDAPMVDFAVRKHPTNGYWYAVGFETWNNSPLLLARASSPSGPWEKLNYKPGSYHDCGCGVFGDTGAPPWANASRPDPNLAFTPDGRSWIFFTGKSTTLEPPEVTWRGGIVEVDINTGKAIGNPVVLFDPEAHRDLAITGASDLNLVSVPGQHDRIFAQTDSAVYPLAILDLPDRVTPTDGRTSTDLVRLDMTRGFGVALGITPVILQTPYEWESGGLVVGANDGGVASYLAGAYLTDLTFKVDFTPAEINQGAINAVAHIGGPNYNMGPGITVQIDATGDNPSIKARIMGSDGATATLNSGVIAKPGTRYSVVLQRVGSTVTLMVNGATKAKADQGSVLSGLYEWSLANERTMMQPARYPFEGTIHSFVVTGGGS